MRYGFASGDAQKRFKMKTNRKQQRAARKPKPLRKGQRRWKKVKRWTKKSIVWIAVIYLVYSIALWAYQRLLTEGLLP